MSFKDISYLELLRPLCSAERNHLCNIMGNNILYILVEGIMRNIHVK